VSVALFVEQFVKLARAGKPMQVHLIGHSTGAILLGHLLTALDRAMPEGAVVDSCSLMAPACSIDFFAEHYKPRLGAGPTLPARIKKMTLYNLDDKLEQSDEVTNLYNKSLLYLVSNAFEPLASKEKCKPLLGMQRFKDLIGTKFPEVFYSPDPKVTTAASHSGFDNDPPTMNHILRNILGKAPTRAFSASDLDY